MQCVNEIHVAYLDDITVYETSEGFTPTEEAQEKLNDVFRRVEIFLEDMGITPENASLDFSVCELTIYLESEPLGFTMEDRLMLLQKLEAFFDVIQYQVDTECDPLNDMGPYVFYGIVDRTD